MKLILSVLHKQCLRRQCEGNQNCAFALVLFGLPCWSIRVPTVAIGRVAQSCAGSQAVAQRSQSSGTKHSGQDRAQGRSVKGQAR